MRAAHMQAVRCLTDALPHLDPSAAAQRLVEEAGGKARLLLLEQGNRGCANLAPFHRQATADWAAEQLGATVSRAVVR
jgi:2,6-dihydroxypseudooxynicotine hydrolase